MPRAVDWIVLLDKYLPLVCDRWEVQRWYNNEAARDDDTQPLTVVTNKALTDEQKQHITDIVTPTKVSFEVLRTEVNHSHLDKYTRYYIALAQCRMAFLNNVAYDPINRHPSDYYSTPPRGTRALLDVETFSGSIWEPACGNGAMAEVLKRRRYAVISSDLHDYGYGITPVDFLQQTECFAPNIITNPPFRLAEQFAYKALELTTGKVAILERVTWLESKQRHRLFTTTPLARVWVFSSRLSMSRNNDPQWGEGSGRSSITAFAWYVWEHGYTGSPVLGWLTGNK